MSWTDKELAEMANASQAEQKFAYNDSYFAEVEAMLPKKKKKFFPFFVLPLIPMMGILGYLGMYEPTSTHAVAGAKTMETNYRNVANAIAQNNFVANPFEAYEEIENGIENNVVRVMNTETSITALPTRVESKPPALHIEPKTASSELSIVSSPLVDKMKESKIEFVEISELAFDQPSIEIIESSPIALLNTNIDQLNILPARLFVISQPAPITFTQMAPFTPRKTWSLYVEAGAGMGESYLTSQIGHTQTASIGAGARYDFRNTFVQFGLGGEFQKVNMEISERSKIYHTSSTELENVMDYKQLYRMQMPFTFGYKLSKHSLQASLIPSYLLGAKMKYTYLENGLAMRNETMYNQRKGWNDFSTSVGFGYGYQLFKGLTLGANMNWQFMNQVNRNEVSEGKIRPFSGQVFIRKTFK